MCPIIARSRLQEHAGWKCPRQVCFNSGCKPIEVAVVDKHLIELQSQVAFQEDLLQELNAVVAQQQNRIDALQRDLQFLADRLAELSARVPDGAVTGAEDERPPHY